MVVEGEVVRRTANAMVIDVVIPARGGSKRLPGKNIAPLGGSPLVSHSIKFAIEHPLVRGVYVSTDSGEIAATARSSGAEIIHRPAPLATDNATTSAVIQHALEVIPRTPAPDLIATLQPTSPLRLTRWLDECAAILQDLRFDSAVTVSPVTAKVGTVVDGEFRPQYQLETRSQDLSPKFRENGVIYLTRSASVAAGSVFGEKIGAVVIDHPFATIDIDNQRDFDHARAVMGLTA